ncbi:hypothetical protein Q4543_10790 [Salipiger sp. 1_MG-2023]|uniref:hypothetical protein n=1 Tax=Salipiger sp. 1_MG-2023 TaxID=3062665 RepID=UPI0026E32633|nr:hypothetical protein [Salipiger sp. 1_MG-2023]MDO6586008.1 hypothetical protein [Salipiger sp. 1_MG-2023]
MTLVVIHPGFHKTGTSTVQIALSRNRALLEPHLRLYLREDFEPLAHSARSYSVSRSDKHRDAIGRNALRFFRGIGRDDPRPVLISSEDLSGHMPGRNGITRYDAAPTILALIAENAAHWFGPSLDLTFYFSTRAPDPWLRSCWWQNLRSTRLTQDLDQFSQGLPDAADLPAIVGAVAARTASCPLEDSTLRPEGPLSPMLDLLSLPDQIRNLLVSPPPMNQQPDLGIAEVLLALNRSGLEDEALSEAKKTMRRLAQKQGNVT